MREQDLAVVIIQIIVQEILNPQRFYLDQKRSLPPTPIINGLTNATPIPVSISAAPIAVGVVAASSKQTIVGDKLVLNKGNNGDVNVGFNGDDKKNDKMMNKVVVDEIDYRKEILWLQDKLSLADDKARMMDYSLQLSKKHCDDLLTQIAGAHNLAAEISAVKNQLDQLQITHDAVLSELSKSKLQTKILTEQRDSYAARLEKRLKLANPFTESNIFYRPKCFSPQDEINHTYNHNHNNYNDQTQQQFPWIDQLLADK